MIRTAVLLTFVLLTTGCAGTIAFEKGASSNIRARNISIDIERKLENMIALDNGEMSRDSVGAVFQHDLDLQVDGQTGYKSVFYFVSNPVHVAYSVYFAPDYKDGEFRTEFKWWPLDLSGRAPEPPQKVCVSVNKLLQSAGSKGWKNLTIGADYTARPARFLSRKSDSIYGPVDDLTLVSSKNSDCLVSFMRMRMSLRPPL